MTITLKKTEEKSCEELVRELDEKEIQSVPIKLQFAGVEDKDVYNITAPFSDEGEEIIAGRVESRDSEHSEVYFFVKKNDKWKPKEDLPTFTLQDPFITFINNDLILGGVEISPHLDNPGALTWRTVFYRGKSINELKPFFTGPNGMKDLRLVELLSGEVGILTRPQGDKGGQGKIGFNKVKKLEDLTIEVIDDTPLLEGQFVQGEWGGANEAHILSNGLVGVLGHIACFDNDGNRHYYPMIFVLNPITGEYSDIELIAKRAHFLPGETKRPDLKDVVFSGGLIRKSDGTANLYAGISDAEAHKLIINDPFLQFEE